MKPVGIHSFALSCSLGSEKQQIWNNICNNQNTSMLRDSSFLNDEDTYIGKINEDIDALERKYAEYDYFANRLLHFTFAKIKQEYQQLINQVPAHRIGIVLGTSTAGVDCLERAIPFYDEQGCWPKEYKPHQQRMSSVSEFLAEYLKVNGPVMSVSTACSSAAKAMLSAQRWINNDICDVVITGGVDVLCQLTLKGFNSLGALSNDLNSPFSSNRKGINIGEAAALFVLKSNSAEINLLGGGESSDAHHISAPDPEAKGAISAIQQALDNSDIKANEVDYINLHGTGTKQNDAMEALAIDTVFGESVPCSSTKSLTGHTLGAAGALELGLSMLSMSKVNHQNDYIPHYYDGHYDESIAQINLINANNQLGKPNTILSNSFAFGGSNASVILSRRSF